MTFVDTHAHLHFPEFESDRKEVIQRAQDHGVRYFVNVGTDLESHRSTMTPIAAIRATARYVLLAAEADRATPSSAGDDMDAGQVDEH